MRKKNDNYKLTWKDDQEVLNEENRLQNNVWYDCIFEKAMYMHEKN